MPHHLRYQSSEWALHHVVSRCINGFSFLKPTPPIVQICTGVLGRGDVLKAYQAHPYGFPEQSQPPLARERRRPRALTVHSILRAPLTRARAGV